MAREEERGLRERERENCGKDLSVGSLIGAKDWDCRWKKYL